MVTTTKNRLVTVGDACAASGVPYRAVWSGRFQGTAKPARPNPPGRARLERYSIPQVLALRVGRILESPRFGLKVPEFAGLVNMLWLTDEAELQRLFAEGREWVMLVGRVALGRALFREEEITANEFIDYAALKAAGLPAPVGLNIGREYRLILEHLGMAGGAQ
jgi:hypothetical protein